MPPGPYRIAVFGAGGLGREVLQTLRDQIRAGADIDVVGCVVDPATDTPATVGGFPVHHDLPGLAADATVRFVVAIGNPAARARIARRITMLAGPRFASVRHPRSIVGDAVSIGEGSIILQAASITTDVRIGSHAVINPQTSIAHDCVLEDWVSLAPGVTLAGGVYIEQGSELGAGVTVIPRQRIGRWSIVGAGAVIIAPVPANATAVGIPARIVSNRPDGWQHDP